MFRIYKNEKIYKNFKIAKILSVISLILSILTVILYIFIPNFKITNAHNIINYNFYVFTILVPFISLSIPSSKKPPQEEIENIAKIYNKFKVAKETNHNNDASNLTTIVIFSFLPYFAAAFFMFLSLFGVPGVLDYINICGRMLPAHIFVYIGDGFLLHSRKLIKQEWKDDPPEFYKKQLDEQKQKQLEQIVNQNTKQYKTLIEQCGFRFFIKYYAQIKRLPLRDVVITENYSSVEREERLSSAKKIIDTGLAEFTFNEILKTYNDILEETEVKQINSILEDIRKTKQQIEELEENKNEQQSI